VAVGLNRENSYASSGIVGDQHELPGFIERDVTRVGSARGDFVQELHSAGLPVSLLMIDGESAYHSAFGIFIFLDFIDRVEEAAARIDRKEGGVDGFRRETQRSQFRRCCIEAVSVNTFALLVSVGADEEKVAALRIIIGCGHGDQRKEEEPKQIAAAGSSHEVIKAYSKA